MADQAPVVHIGENSPQEVALKLLHFIRASDSTSKVNARAEVLDLYAECLQATMGGRIVKR